MVAAASQSFETHHGMAGETPSSASRQDARPQNQPLPNLDNFTPSDINPVFSPQMMQFICICEAWSIERKEIL